MLDQVKTVRTQAVQLWLKPDLGGRGWPTEPPILGAFAQPLDTWADIQLAQIYTAHQEAAEQDVQGAGLDPNRPLLQSARTAWQASTSSTPITSSSQQEVCACLQQLGYAAA